MSTDRAALNEAWAKQEVWLRGQDPRTLFEYGWQAAQAQQHTEAKSVPITLDSQQAMLDVCMKTLRQIQTTPRNKGARRNASATVKFIETQEQHIPEAEPQKKYWLDGQGLFFKSMDTM